MSSGDIRVAAEADAQAIQGIYAPMVEHTATSFEEVPPTVGEMAQRINNTLAMYPYLVAERDSHVQGFAFAGPHRPRAAYRWSVDVSLYIAPSAQRSGIGRQLYTELLHILEAQGFHAAYATIALPNPGSLGLHQAMGFILVGTSPEVGFKLGQWRDVSYWRRALNAATPPKRIIPFAEFPL
ncbi:arsinothricin resistance N-acetyltransferase ArsN1 family B [Pseudomonas sp. RIT-PI-S]|uniref:arsinothricin resistance N-acetyltransferase ArsN1 family B n=1 Tax=Pseudomonas sp. RIT-PI-S TaxID=3035295 RepID=UPI0021D881A7|nr:arsinothricin resistance N-acetyltransferase ArsN1 family B [Pseudomonas sp. RIT-PI-S]